MTARAGKVRGARDLFIAAMSRLREEHKARFSSTSRSRRRLRRRLSAGLLLLVGLLLAGGLAATLTPKPQVAVADESALSLVRNGKQIFETSCISCHGANLQGMPDRGPSLIGVGEAARERDRLAVAVQHHQRGHVGLRAADAELQSAHEPVQRMRGVELAA